jgi:hypothetical protein
MLAHAYGSNARVIDEAWRSGIISNNSKGELIIQARRVSGSKLGESLKARSNHMKQPVPGNSLLLEDYCRTTGLPPIRRISGVRTSFKMAEVFRQAVQLAMSHGDPTISPDYFFAAALLSVTPLTSLLGESGLTPEAITTYLSTYWSSNLDKGLPVMPTTTLRVALEQGRLRDVFEMPVFNSGRDDAVRKFFEHFQLNFGRVRSLAYLTSDLSPFCEELQIVIAPTDKKLMVSVCDILDHSLVRMDGYSTNPGVPVRECLSHRPIFLESEISQFEDLINDSAASEGDIHDFFLTCPKFLLGLDYRALHSKLTLVTE